MTSLNTKLLRDLRRMWAQVLAIALVVAGGLSTLVLSIGSYRSLDETRIAYYEAYRFADVFASLKRAPKALLTEIAAIPGVAAAEARVSKLALLDIPNFDEPATGHFVSLPEGRQPLLNRLYIRSGRLPAPSTAEEVVISEEFAKAHALMPGARFSAILGGRKRELDVVGVALSPEFVYAIGPGDIMPDNRRFGIVWMSEKALASAYDLDGAFSSLTLKLVPGASEPEVIARLDVLLERYGGRAAYGRKDQTSHAFLDHELDMLVNMSRTLPPVFLLVSAFLINLTLGRLVTLEREQIGLLKALGYRDLAIAWHYMKFVIVVVLIGIAIGSAAGTWLGVYVTGLFGDYFHFPFLLFDKSGDIYVLAAALCLAAALVGAAAAFRDIVRLPPAVAMQPPVPPRFRRVLPARFALPHIATQSTTMMVRGITHHPLRAGFTSLGVALGTSILVVSLFTRGTMEQLIDVTYFLADRQDAIVSFIEKRPREVAYGVARLPGVLAVEPYREVPVRIRNANIERRIVITSRPRDADLGRIIDVDLRPVVLPESGLAISDMLARILDVRVGDVVEIDLLENRMRTVALPVSALIEDYFGIKGMMDTEAISRLMREAPAANGVRISFDAAQLARLNHAVKNLPTVSGMALQQASLANFRAALAVLITTMGGIYTTLAAIIAFGVVYNSARISLSERARELASLRVLGFTRGEVFRILLLELVVLVAVAQPPGWLIGYGLSWVMRESLAGELMRVPLIVENSTYIFSSAIVIAAAAVSALVVRRRIDRLDLVSVLKTRD